MTRRAKPEPAWTQLSITGEDNVDHYARDEVMAINGQHTTNGQRVADLASLGYLPSPVLDPTHGYGLMWTRHVPQFLIRCDINPARGVQVASFTDLPFADNHFASCIYDPPYRFAGTPTDTDDGGHDDFYGTDIYRTKAEQIQLILDGATECARVTREFLIVKIMDQVVAGSVGWQSLLVTDHLRRRGWVLKDSLLLVSYRAQPSGRSQQNARRNYSTFLVFVPGQVVGFRSWALGKGRRRSSSPTRSPRTQTTASSGRTRPRVSRIRIPR